MVTLSITDPGSLYILFLIYSKCKESSANPWLAGWAGGVSNRAGRVGASRARGLAGLIGLCDRIGKYWFIR